jgi:hypothetical protein
VAAALFAQQGRRGLGQPQGAGEVGLHLVADVLFGQFLGGAEHAVAGVVDDDVQAAEVCVCPLDGSVAVAANGG